MSGLNRPPQNKGGGKLCLPDANTISIPTYLEDFITPEHLLRDTYLICLVWHDWSREF